MPPALRSLLLTDLGFPEAPRWHGGRLWFSDMSLRTVFAVDGAGRLEPVIAVAGRPSGLGWLPGGALLVVSMEDRRLLRLQGTRLVEVADLRAYAPSFCNDMVVDSQGHAFIGNFGFDFLRGEPVRPTVLVCVDAAGGVAVVADDLLFPNGMTISPDGRTLVLAETYGCRLTAFDLLSDGALAQRRLWADVAPAFPDGICLDQEGAVWVACPPDGEVLRVQSDGAVLERIRTAGRHPLACMLGGDAGRTLFICTATRLHPQLADGSRDGAIEAVEVSVPRAGLP